MTLPTEMTITKGMRLHHNPTNVTFTVLCNCRSVQPEHHRQRYVSQHRDQYSIPTPEKDHVQPAENS